MSSLNSYKREYGEGPGSEKFTYIKKAGVYASLAEQARNRGDLAGAAAHQAASDEWSEKARSIHKPEKEQGV